ncbi:integral membrane protein DUF106-domain-containing protein [Kockiozyma suomiensis]|uniref:integral membrane protein DUF106-domain-containing protein n=1 Tax=Kockiozyma suomiensis TaxID=1337062 RepID=UPI0033432038
MAAAPDLVLDSSLRDWVLFPILLVMILVGILRHYVTQLLQTTPKQLDLLTIREQQALSRGASLRGNGKFIPQSSFLSRKLYLTQAFKDGIFLKDQEAFKNKDEPKQPANPLAEPGGMDQMANMLKGNMVMIVPQTLLMSWINFFFSGFILMKLPFPLTIRFKSILQSGVMTRDLDVRWVSSISWYFLCLFGLRSVYDIILGSNNSASGGMDMGGMNMAAGGIPGMQPGQDVYKLHLSEAENIELTSHEYLLEDIEDRLLIKYDMY